MIKVVTPVGIHGVVVIGLNNHLKAEETVIILLALQRSQLTVMENLKRKEKHLALIVKLRFETYGMIL